MNLNFFLASRFLVLQEYNSRSGEMGMWVWKIRCQLQHSVSHFGDFFTLWEGVSEGLSGNHQNIGCELHSYLEVQENLI